MALNGSDSDVEILGDSQMVVQDVEEFWDVGVPEEVGVIGAPGAVEMGGGDEPSGEGEPSGSENEESSSNEGNESGSSDDEAEEEAEESSIKVPSGSTSRSEGVSGGQEPAEASPGKKGSRRTELHYTEILSSVTKKEAVELRNRYYIPDDFEVRVPKGSNRMNQPIERTLAVHIPTLRAGLRFPIPDPVQYILKILNLCPTQLLPNSYSLLLSFIVFMRCLGHPASYANFYELFVCQASTKSGSMENTGFYFLSARQGRKIFRPPTSSHGLNWKSKWVFIRAPKDQDFEVTREWKGTKSVTPPPVESTTLVPEELERALKEAPQSSFFLCQEDVLAAAGLSPAPPKNVVSLGILLC